MDDEDDLGTVRWFGESWGAPMNDPRTQVPTPTWERCDCGQPILTGDQGLSIPKSEGGRVFYHLVCFYQSLGLA